MAKLTEEKIFSMTEKIVYEKGMEKTTLYDVARNLGVTHAALYKHYRNKEDLFQKLALHWLEETSRELFEWVKPVTSSGKQALHDWLWILANTKKKLYHTDKRMFFLYTDYIEKNGELVEDHLQHLAEKAEGVSGWKGEGQAIITAFIYFHNPYFANRWSNEEYAALFEKVWRLVSEDKK